MRIFREFFEKEEKKEREQLTRISDVLKKIEDFHVYDFSQRESNPYIFIKFDVDSDLNERLRDLKLGIRIFTIGGKLVYRLQKGPHGHQIGSSKKVEDKDEIEELMTQGKTAFEAFNEIVKKIPNELRMYMKKVYVNIAKNATKPDKDREKSKETEVKILRSLFTGNEDGAFKM